MKNIFKLLPAITLFCSSHAFGQECYAHDRVYAANQVSNTVSVVNPANNKLLGEIKLGKPYPNVLSPLYRGQSLVHGMGYSEARKMLAVVSIGSNSVALISTETNKVLKIIYVGRSPHEATFTPDGKQIWVTVRGEAYVSVIDAASMKEVKHLTVADGPGMVSFTKDGKLAYICSSFTAELDIVNTANYKIIKKIPVVSPFSPNIFTSLDGNWVAMTHKDIGKITVVNTRTQKVEKVLTTGPITNHVTFCILNGKQLMLATIGGENKVLVFDVAHDFKLTNTIPVGALPHGIWPSKDGRLAYTGLEYADEVQGIDLEAMKTLPVVEIGQSPQALVYANNAVTKADNAVNLSPLNDTAASRIFTLTNHTGKKAIGRIAIRSIGLTDLVEQIFTGLEPGHAYTLALSHSENGPLTADYQVNSFTTDANGKYIGQSTGLVKSISTAGGNAYKHLVLVDESTKQTELSSQ